MIGIVSWVGLLTLTAGIGDKHMEFEIKKQHTDRYFGKFTGTPTGYSNPANYKPYAIPTEFVVIHCTEGHEDGDKKVLSGRTARRVSAHYYITRSAEIIEYVQPGIRAWHAGGSFYELEGRAWSKFNNFSIGIELESRYVNDPEHGNSGYTSAQLRALYWLHRRLQESYPAIRNPQRTVGHDQISGYRGKKDPGPAFPWGEFWLEAFGIGKEPEPGPLSVMLDGVLIDEPLLLHEGKSYLPVRALAEAVGLKVKWHAQDKRVELFSKAKGEGSA